MPALHTSRLVAHSEPGTRDYVACAQLCERRAAVADEVFVLILRSAASY
jgi:hypothetical protein